MVLRQKHSTVRAAIMAYSHLPINSLADGVPANRGVALLFFARDGCYHLRFVTGWS